MDITDELQAELDSVLTDHRELNTSNYGHDDVCQLNNWAIGACETLERADLHIRSLTERLEKAGAWISVSDRLPEPGVTVLACYTNSHGKVRRIRAEYVAPKSRVADYPCDTDEECVEYDEAADQHYWLPGWYECVDNWSDYTSLAVTEGEVSNWTPLPAAPGETAPPTQQPNAAVMPCGTAVSNVYEAYEAGKKAAKQPDCPQCAGTGYDCPDCITTAEQPDTVKVGRELLDRVAYLLETLDEDGTTHGELRALLAGGEA